MAERNWVWDGNAWVEALAPQTGIPIGGVIGLQAALAPLTNATTTGTTILQSNAATVAGIVEPYIQLDAAAPTYVTIYCPGDVDKPRNHPVTGAVLPDAPACIVLWRKATFPTVASTYAQNLDDYRSWDG